MNYSLTITGLVTILLAQFVPMEEVETVLEAVGILVAWYGRIRLQDLTWYGQRK